MIMPAETLYDVLIVGGSHAGLSAALTLYRQLHTILILDSGTPRNSWPLPTHIVSGWEGKRAGELRSAARTELMATGLVTFVECEATSVRRTGSLSPPSPSEHDGFEVCDAHGARWRGRKLLLAAGKRNVFPDIPGFSKNYPERIFHCMFTFGYEHRGASHAGLLADGALSSPMHADMVVGDAKKFASRVTVYTNGDRALKVRMMDQVRRGGVVFDDRSIRTINRSDKGLKLEMEDGQYEDMEFLVHQPTTKIDLPLVEQLGLQLDERGDIVSMPPFFQTHVPGVFVAGDCATPFKIIPTAMSMGANAGAGIARALAIDVVEKGGIKDDREQIAAG